jgi:PAS domain S-box-containing protein
MKANLKFLNSLFEVAHVEYQTYDITNHKLIFSSGFAHKILGYSMEEYYKLSDDFFKELVHPDDRQTVLDSVNKIIHSSAPEVVEMTVRVRKHDGDFLWVHSRQMVYEKDEINNICTVIRESKDVTEVVLLEDALREKVKQLQTISYKNSHLLRSPVASIIGLINLVEEHHLISQHNIEIFNYLKHAIEKLDTVIHEINNIAKT